MILRLARNSRDGDADLRQSYRQRLDEILESDRSVSGQEPAVEPVAAAAPVEAPSGPGRPATYVAEEPVPGGAAKEFTAPPEEPRMEAAEPLEEPESSVVDTLGAVAEKLALSLVEGLVAVMSNQEKRRAAEAARLDKRLEALRVTIQSQTELISGLAAANDRLLRNQQHVQQRLDSQAQVIRELNAMAAAQQNRWNAYRAAVDKLKEIKDLPPLPARLPDNL